MKSDREMIESLLKRRDEYMAQNGSFKRVKNKIRNKARDKVSSPVRLIPKIAITSFAVIALIVCVLAFNGVFDRKKINIDLIGAGSSNMPNTAIPAASAAEDKMIAEEIVNTFDSVVKEYLAAHADKADEVKKFVGKYAKGGNYFSVSDPTLASKLLNDFKEAFTI